MAYSYSEPMNYSPQNYYQQQNPQSVSWGAAGGLLGGVAGCITASIKNPCKSDSFVKKVYLKQADKDEKVIYKQNLNILKKIKNIKTVESLQKLFEKNKEAAQKLGINIDNINKSELKNNIKTIKEKIEADNKAAILNVKNNIVNYLKGDKEGIDSKLVKTIKKAKIWEKTKKIAKYTVVGAITTGLLASIAQAFISSKSQSVSGQQNV